MTQVQQAQDAIKLIAYAYQYADCDEHREGIHAFTEKRPPQFLTACGTR
jgi:1,4-dihydroxy-2-naphthoyl-CoA synthase